MLKKQQININKLNNDFRITSLTRFLQKKFAIKTGKLIDVGAGNGIMLKFFKKKGFKVAGVEMVKDLYEIMKKDKELKEVKIMQGDITDKKGEGEHPTLHH